MKTDARVLSGEFAIARQMDDDDPLSCWRERFHVPVLADGEPSVYLCGHSLGLQPASVDAYVQSELDAWRRLGVKGHFQGEYPWATYERALRDPLALLTGGRPAEVVAMNSLTINLHLLLVSFYRPDAKRFRVVMDGNAFPSDRFAIESQVRMHGRDPAEAIVEISPAVGEHVLSLTEVRRVLDSLGDSVALVFFPGVHYYSGQVFNLAELAGLAHDHGCVFGADLAHSIGNVPLTLHDSNVDFAVWCSYKYLNAGPGAIGGCFVHERHGSTGGRPRLAGWWGQRFDKRFQMQMPFDPTDGAEGWQVSNPPILQMAALRASLAAFEGVGLQALRAKSVQLLSFFDHLWDDVLHTPLARVTPLDMVSRGAQVSLDTGPLGRELHERVTTHGVICDWRPPSALRLSFVPFYTTFIDVCRCVSAFAACLDLL